MLKKNEFILSKLNIALFLFVQLFEMFTKIYM